MESLTLAQLKELAQQTANPSISIFLPTHRAGQGIQLSLLNASQYPAAGQHDPVVRSNANRSYAVSSLVEFLPKE